MKRFREFETVTMKRTVAFAYLDRTATELSHDPFLRPADLISTIASATMGSRDMLPLSWQALVRFRWRGFTHPSKRQRSSNSSGNSRPQRDLGSRLHKSNVTASRDIVRSTEMPDRWKHVQIATDKGFARRRFGYAFLLIKPSAVGFVRSRATG